MNSKNKNQKNPPSPEEVQRMKDDHWEKMKREGGTFTEDEWTKLMDYYDDKKYLDEAFEKMDIEKLKKSMSKKK